MGDSSLLQKRPSLRKQNNMNLKSSMKLVILVAYLNIIISAPPLPNYYTFAVDTVGFTLTTIAGGLLLNFLNTRPVNQKNLLNRILVLFVVAVLISTLRNYVLTVMTCFFHSQLQRFVDEFPILVYSFLVMRLTGEIEAIIVCSLSMWRLILFAAPAIFHNVNPMTGVITAVLGALAVTVFDIIYNWITCYSVLENPVSEIIINFQAEIGLSPSSKNLETNNTNLETNNTNLENTNTNLNQGDDVNNICHPLPIVPILFICPIILEFVRIVVVLIRQQKTTPANTASTPTPISAPNPTPAPASNATPAPNPYSTPHPSPAHNPTANTNPPTNPNLNPAPHSFLASLTSNPSPASSSSPTPHSSPTPKPLSAPNHTPLPDPTPAPITSPSPNPLPVPNSTPNHKSPSPPIPTPALYTTSAHDSLVSSLSLHSSPGNSSRCAPIHKSSPNGTAAVSIPSGPTSSQWDSPFPLDSVFTLTAKTAEKLPIRKSNTVHPSTGICRTESLPQWDNPGITAHAQRNSLGTRDDYLSTNPEVTTEPGRMNLNRIDQNNIFSHVRNVTKELCFRTSILLPVVTLLCFGPTVFNLCNIYNTSYVIVAERRICQYFVMVLIVSLDKDLIQYYMNKFD